MQRPPVFSSRILRFFSLPFSLLLGAAKLLTLLSANGVAWPLSCLSVRGFSEDEAVPLLLYFFRPAGKFHGQRCPINFFLLPTLDGYIEDE